jgi:hypothetical protein
VKRLPIWGLGATLLVVAVLAVSLVAGLGRGGEAAPTGAAQGTAGAVRAEGRVRVEVLNAAGSAGLARLATHTLRSAGFDVVYFGNAAGERADSSVVIDRVGDVASARSVAAALGIERVVSQPDSTLYLDVSVVLGREWRPKEAPLPLAPAERAEK